MSPKLNLNWKIEITLIFEIEKIEIGLILGISPQLEPELIWNKCGHANEHLYYDL